MKSPLLLMVLTGLGCLLTGCTTYFTPGAKADLQALGPPSIEEQFALKPANPFPAAIAAVRVQAPTYDNYYLSRHGGKYGGGRFSVITLREVESEEQFQKVSGLPQVRGVVTLNRLLLPSRFDGDQEIRLAAARLQADLVLVYTFDTAFYDHDSAKPLSVITLGLSPTRKITATSTVSALLLDTRTGYIYSAYEATERQEIRSTSWGSVDSADEARRGAESQAFNKFVDQFTQAWPQIIRGHAVAVNEN